MQKQRSIEADITGLQKERDKFARKQAEIIKQQEQVIEASIKGISMLNSDLSAIRKRLEKYANENPRAMDRHYHELKDKYIQKVQERAVLERAKTTAEESIAAGQLQRIPGEDIQ